MTRAEVHAQLVRDALHYTRMAFASALRGGRRTDCLRVALVALDGAATNVAMEDDDTRRAAATELARAWQASESGVRDGQ